MVVTMYILSSSRKVNTGINCLYRANKKQRGKVKVCLDNLIKKGDMSSTVHRKSPNDILLAVLDATIYVCKLQNEDIAVAHWLHI